MFVGQREVKWLRLDPTYFSIQLERILIQIGNATLMSVGEGFMKKVFQFKVPNHKPDRQVEAIRAEIKKYLARERRKKLPEDADFWEFMCRIGESQEASAAIAEVDIKPMLNQYYEQGKESFYLEILAKPGKKSKRPE